MAATLGFVAFAAAAFGDVLPAGAYSSCTWSPEAPQVAAGQTATITITCSPDPGEQPALSVTDAGGFTANVTAGAAANTFTLTVTAPASVGRDYASIRLAVAGGSFPQSINVPIEVQRALTPECFSPRSMIVLAGQKVPIEIECEGSSRTPEATTLEVLEQPKHGSLGAAGFGLGWTYTPRRGFVGADGIVFQARNSFGVSPRLSIAIRVRKPTRYERAAVYHQSVCADAPSNTSCRQGRGRRTKGGSGTGKVSHKNWPAISGVYFSFPSSGGGKLVGGELNDQLTGHHGSDTIFGRAGSDVIWGDWDPANNNGRQRDSLNGGAGRDFIYTSHGYNRVTGGAGNDFIWAFYGHGVVDCGPGIDKVRLSGRKSAYKLRSCERRGKF